jgi:Retrotransposon gag protein
MATTENKSLHPLPFNGSTWVDFVKAVETCFRPGDDQEIAQQEMDVLKQGRGLASTYAASFLELFPRTGLSQKDAMHRFKQGLSKEDRTWLALSSLVNKPTTLLDLCNQVVTNEFEMKGSTNLSNQRSSTTANDPFAMDIDATRTNTRARPDNNIPGPNGYTRTDYLKKMQGHCFGCGSRSHSKAQCRVVKEPCPYCKRNGHLELVCQDKFMGHPKGRGLANRNNNRAQVRATTHEYDNYFFDVCDSKPPTPSTLSTIAASSSSSNSDIERLERLQQQQLKIAETIAKMNKDF